MATKQKRGICIFCGQSGASNEHIIAKWIGRSMSSAPPRGVAFRFRHRSANPAAGVAASEKIAKGTAFKTRAMCRDCNGGWMGQLEEAVKPILEPMLRGQRCLIDAEAKRILAFWVTKTVLAFQSVESDTTTFARPLEFKQLVQSKQALPASQIWLGATRYGNEMFYRAHSACLPEEDSMAANGFGATLIVGHAAFYLLHGFEEPLGLQLRVSISSALRKIHPTDKGTIAWPPRSFLEPDNKNGLAELVIANSIRSA